ncbi:MAG: hypothetical protein LQ346_008354 [Caloplaca aetnensis]|nr:MAG: hypothetical protein LQ346_008354 [Caloplaca aetnensis]
MLRYQYQPLDPEAKTIRLMRLLPGSFEDDICVSLKTTVLHDKKIPKFEALSYAWGSKEDPAQISITPHSQSNLLSKWARILKTGKRVDACLDVTQNLAVALRHLRSRKRKRVLWIDAICVNQQNLEERGHQVQRMADIYRNAKQVIAWLGPEGDNSALAMETLDSVVGLQPNYRQTPRKTFQDVVLRALSLGKELDLLAYCEWNTDLVEKPSWIPSLSKLRISNRILNVRCCYGSKAEAECAGNGVLKATGICAAEISGIEVVTLVTIDDEAWDSKIQSAVQRLMESVDLDAPYIDGSQMIEALCRTLCMDGFADSCTPARPQDPDRVTSLQYLRRLSQNSPGGIEPYGMYLSDVVYFTKGRHFFTTKQGYIGLLPKAGKIGDQVCVILGCQRPLLLRKMESGNMAVIGDCYIHGLMNGEALLGTLPLKWRCSYILTAGWGYQNGFVDQETGDHLFEDPRLGELPPGWRREDPESPADPYNWFVNDETGERTEFPIDPRMTADALRARGVPLQEFLLE